MIGLMDSFLSHSNGCDHSRLAWDRLDSATRSCSFSTTEIIWCLTKSLMAACIHRLATVSAVERSLSKIFPAARVCIPGPDKFFVTRICLPGSNGAVLVRFGTSKYPTAAAATTKGKGVALMCSRQSVSRLTFWFTRPTAPSPCLRMVSISSTIASRGSFAMKCFPIRIGPNCVDRTTRRP